MHEMLCGGSNRFEASVLNQHMRALLFADSSWSAWQMIVSIVYLELDSVVAAIDLSHARTAKVKTGLKCRPDACSCCAGASLPDNSANRQVVLDIFGSCSSRLLLAFVRHSAVAFEICHAHTA